MEDELNITVDLKNIDETIEKAVRLNELLKEAKSIAQELASYDLEFTFSNQD